MRKGTPTTLLEAIRKGLAEDIDNFYRIESDPHATVVEKHVRDFLAQRFGEMILVQDVTNIGVLEVLFEHITGKELPKNEPPKGAA